MSSLADFRPLQVDASRPYAILADIHGNIEAFGEVLRWLDTGSLHQAVVLGDLIGYGASPAAVLDRVRERGFAAIRGNHEQMMLGRDDGGSREIKRRAYHAIEWTRKVLDAGHVAWLSSLPLAGRIGDDIFAVHGSLAGPSYCHAYIYDLSLDLNIGSLRELRAPAGSLVLHGHTHWPRLYRVHNPCWEELELDAGRQRLDRRASYFVNPGSVGYPRDGDLRSSFMVWDPARRELELVRLSYDVEGAARRIEAAGYHSEIAARLREAR